MSRRLSCVLLVDDNEADNFFHEHAIQKSGAVEKVLTAQDAREALRLIVEGEVRPELILLDVNMPSMNGWEFLDAYEKLAEAQQGAIIVMLLSVSLDAVQSESAAARRNLAGFVDKPLKAEGFQEILDKHFPD